MYYVWWFFVTYSLFKLAQVIEEFIFFRPVNEAIGDSDETTRLMLTKEMDETLPSRGVCGHTLSHSLYHLFSFLATLSFLFTLSSLFSLLSSFTFLLRTLYPCLYCSQHLHARCWFHVHAPLSFQPKLWVDIHLNRFFEWLYNYTNWRHYSYWLSSLPQASIHVHPDTLMCEDNILVKKMLDLFAHVGVRGYTVEELVELNPGAITIILSILFFYSNITTSLLF